MDPSLVLPADPEPEAPAKAGSQWRVVGAVAAGSSHERLGLSCQDAVAYQADEQTLFVALSDGAGTAERSQYGAQTAVQAALDAITTTSEAGLPAAQAGWQETLRAAVNAARSALESLAEFEQHPLRDYAATLILAVATADTLVVAQLGDGAVIAGESPDELFLVNRAQRGEYANETYFLTQEDALEQVQITAHDKVVNWLVVMSDGLTRLAIQLPAQTPHLPFFRPLLEFAAQANEEEQAAAQLVEFLTSDRVCDRTDDDKSLVLAVRMLGEKDEPDREETESELQALVRDDEQGPGATENG